MTTYINGNQYSGGISTFIELTDAPDAYGFPSQVVRMNSAGDALEFATITSGSAAFTDLTDAPASYTVDDIGKAVVVNATYDGLEFATVTSGDVIGPVTTTENKVPQWDSVTKTLKDGLTVGTAASNLVQLDGDAKLPAVDGSALTGISGLDITGLTAETSIADDDLIPIYDTSVTANRKMTRANLITGLAPTIHNLVDTTNHPVTGLTTGHVLQALSATTYGFGAISVTGASAFLKQWSIEGVVFETTFLHWVVPAAGTFATVIMSLESAPSASTTYCKVQVMKNGLLETDSVFTSDTPMQISDSTSATNGVYQAAGTLDGTVTVAAGDVIWCRVNQADDGSAGLLVQIKVNFT
ncbi:MAG: hypothetical protein WC877_00115 [Dehalococcoidales bacterium]|jgi:hypothetical protein